MALCSMLNRLCGPAAVMHLSGIPKGRDSIAESASNGEIVFVLIVIVLALAAFGAHRLWLWAKKNSESAYERTVSALTGLLNLIEKGGDECDASYTRSRVHLIGLETFNEIFDDKKISNIVNRVYIAFIACDRNDFRTARGIQRDFNVQELFVVAVAEGNPDFDCSSLRAKGRTLYRLKPEIHGRMRRLVELGVLQFDFLAQRYYDTQVRRK